MVPVIMLEQRLSHHAALEQATREVSRRANRAESQMADFLKEAKQRLEATAFTLAANAIQNAGADASPVSGTAQAEAPYGSNLHSDFIATSA